MDTSQIKKLLSLISVLRFIDKELILEIINVWSRRIGDKQVNLLAIDYFQSLLRFRLTCSNRGKNCSCETKIFTQTEPLASANFFVASVLIPSFLIRSCW